MPLPLGLVTALEPQARGPSSRAPSAACRVAARVAPPARGQAMRWPAPPSAVSGQDAAGGAVVAALAEQPQPAPDRVVVDRLQLAGDDLSVHDAERGANAIDAHQIDRGGGILKRRADGKPRVCGASVCRWRLIGLARAAGGTTSAGRRPASTSPPLGRAPSATAPPDAAGATAPAPQTPRPREPPAAGGSQRVRVPATFTLRGGTLTPREVSIPAFLAVQVSVAAADGRAHTVTIAADRALSPGRARRQARVGPAAGPGAGALRRALRWGPSVLAVGGEPGRRSGSAAALAAAAA